MKFLYLIILLSLASAISCRNSSESEKSTTPVRRSLEQRMNENNGYKQDADGNWIARSDRRSQYENKGEAAYFKKNFKKQAYKKGEYAKKSWWGNKDYDRQSYAGKIDGSRFQKTAAQQGQGAREAKTVAEISGNYETDRYATNAAREAGASQIAKPNNSEIETRRKVFDQPEIIDWRERRSLSLDQSKGILGR